MVYPDRLGVRIYMASDSRQLASRIPNVRFGVLQACAYRRYVDLLLYPRR